MTDKKEETPKNNLLDFKWDDSFDFSEEIQDTTKEETTEETKEEEEETKKEETEKKETKEETKEEKEEKEETEGTKEKEEKKPFEETEEEEEKTEDGFYTGLAKDLKDIGVFTDIDIPDDEEITEDKFVELQQQEIEKRVENSLNNFVSDLDDDAKAFIQFKKQGGSTKQFFDILKTQPAPDELDIENEESVSKFMIDYYITNDEMDIEDAKERVEWLKEKEKLVDYAQKYHQKVISKKKEQEQQLIKQQEEAKKLQKEQVEVYKQDLNKFITDTKEFKGIVLDDTKKKEIYNAITKPTVKTEIGYMTPLQVALNKIQENKEALVLLTNWALNDFSTDMFKVAFEKKVTRDTKNKLSRTKKQKRPTTSNNTVGGKNAWDFFQ